MKILTANIGMGLRDVDHLWKNMRGIAAYHGWGPFLIGILARPLQGRWAGPPYWKKRTDYLRANENLDPTFEMIRRESPDVVILSEVVPEIHSPRIEERLKELGFKTISYGLGAKYPDAHVTTYVAAKEAGEALPCSMPQLPYPACGGGIAGVRLVSGVSIIGLHAAVGVSKLWRSQVQAVADIATQEQARGNRVVITGDWNETEETIMKQASFAKLGLVSVNKEKVPTCPISLPRFLQKSVDHIFVPADWSIKNFKATPFGSDHLALLAEADMGIYSSAQLH
ncbi:MAG TPA: hypothetical protein VGP13_00605 [Candidatus Paceibacterota bacterium]|jgi:endonuclease/exonuclease/phosphatase family metal-dependent hydrolase|nr:hypothetical protein [Candidatus Paceibacterota bacterium]